GYHAGTVVLLQVRDQLPGAGELVGRVGAFEYLIQQDEYRPAGLQRFHDLLQAQQLRLEVGGMPGDGVLDTHGGHNMQGSTGKSSGTYRRAAHGQQQVAAHAAQESAFTAHIGPGNDQEMMG